MARGAHNFKDETGNVYGRLTVLKYAGKHRLGNAQWECRCECGEIVFALGHKMRNGSKRSCGCLRRDTAKQMRWLSPEETERRRTQPRKCTRCLEIKDASMFEDINRHYCKPCGKEAMKGYIRKRGGHIAGVLKKNYGMTIADRDGLLAAQKGRCAICKKLPEETLSKRVVIDHDHSKSDKRRSVRGIICDPCNYGLGSFLDDEQLLQSAIKYLRSYRLGKIPLDNLAM